MPNEHCGCWGIKTVEYRIDAELLHAQEHIAHGRIGRLLDNLLLVCKRLLVFTHSLRVVVKIHTIMAMVMAMLMARTRFALWRRQVPFRLSRPHFDLQTRAWG